MSKAQAMPETRRGPTPRTFLKLGRVSNVPTVWSNVLTGTVLAGGHLSGADLALVLVAMTLFYVGGMYLNDWFDRDIDARQRSNRPIPAGEISAVAVVALGSAMLALGIALMFATGLRGLAASAIVLGLPAAILLYNWWHKGNVLSPILMGLCRALVVIGAAAVALQGAAVPAHVIGAAAVLLLYIGGLTYAAKQESLDRIGNLWPLVMLAAPLVLAWPALLQGPVGIFAVALWIGWTLYCVWLLAKRPMPGAVPRAVVSLIAGVSLVDASLLIAHGAVVPALVAVACFAATLALQRLVSGT